MTMSLTGSSRAQDDGKAEPVGTHDGMHLFDWYFSGTRSCTIHCSVRRPDQYRGSRAQCSPRAVRSFRSPHVRHHQRLEPVAIPVNGPGLRAHSFTTTITHTALEPHLRDRRHRLGESPKRARVANARDIKLGGASPASKRSRPACSTSSSSISHRCSSAVGAPIRCTTASVTLEEEDGRYH